MKTMIGFMAALLLTGVARAQLDLPREVLKMTELDKARAQAKREGEALLYLKVNPGDARDFMEEAVEDYVSDFKRYGPILLVPLNVDPPNLPEPVAKAFDGMSGGYPQLVAADVDDDSVIVSVPYISQDDRDDEMKAHRRTLHKYLQDKKNRRPVPVPKPLY